MTFIIPVVALLLMVPVLKKPYLGLVFIIASLPITDLLPDVPLVSSIVPVFGAITVMGFLLSKKTQYGKSKARVKSVHIVALLLIIWMFISNPQAAWLGQDRNWVFTFFQLWVLLWLAGELLDAPEKHKVLFFVYSLAAVVSAIVTIQQGRIGDDIDLSLRASGLTEGANSASRYFVIAIAFLFYLWTTISGRFSRLLFMTGLIICFFGLLFTVSRTGYILLLAVLGLTIIMGYNLRYRFQILVFFALVLGVFLFFSDNILFLLRSIFPAIVSGSDTIGLRYALWAAGWRMWLAYPIQGVGIGMFRFELPYFAENTLNPRFLALVSHNMYVQMLSETGIVGFFLFIFLLAKTLQSLWRLIHSTDEISSVYKVWLTVFVVMLLGGLTKTDHIDKMLWITIGIGSYFQGQAKMYGQETREYNELHLKSRVIRLGFLEGK